MAANNQEAAGDFFLVSLIFLFSVVHPITIACFFFSILD
jgi:hypothetical protein